MFNSKERTILASVTYNFQTKNYKFQTLLFAILKACANILIRRLVKGGRNYKPKTMILPPRDELSPATDTAMYCLPLIEKDEGEEDA